MTDTLRGKVAVYDDVLSLQDYSEFGQVIEMMAISAVHAFFFARSSRVTGISW